MLRFGYLLWKVIRKAGLFSQKAFAFLFRIHLLSCPNTSSNGLDIYEIYWSLDSGRRLSLMLKSRTHQVQSQRYFYRKGKEILPLKTIHRQKANLVISKDVFFSTRQWHGNQFYAIALLVTRNFLTPTYTL